jgi:hypothetical protein
MTCSHARWEHEWAEYKVGKSVGYIRCLDCGELTTQREIELIYKVAELEARLADCEYTLKRVIGAMP